jgi:hypothetical protein
VTTDSLLSSNEHYWGWESRTFQDYVTNKIWIRRQAELDGKIIQVHLVYFHQISADNAELRLVGNVDGQDYILWWSDIGRFMPLEFVCEVANNKEDIALAFRNDDGKYLFYEIKIKKAFEEAKAANNRVLPSAWAFSGDYSMALVASLNKTNDLRQEIIISKLPSILVPMGSHTGNLFLHEESGRWIAAFDMKGVLPEIRYYYQYPVGGTGLTFLKKERLSQDDEDNQAYVGKLWIALGVVGLFIAARIIFAFRKRAKQKLAA